MNEKKSKKPVESNSSMEELRYLAKPPSADFMEHARLEFLANMNHDLRTPLNAVIGFAQIIEKEIFGQVEPQYLEYARHIQESGYDLLSKIEDLLALAEIETAHSIQDKKPAPQKHLVLAD